MLVTIYTTSSCSSCRKAKKWMEKHQIPYREINLFVKELKKEELINILKRTDNGLEDIVSKRSKVISECSDDFDSFTFNDAIEFLTKNPSAMKRPILIDDIHFQIGYNEDEIRAFIPKEMRKRFCESCSNKKECPIHKSKEIDLNESTNNL
ncbi:MAG: transcriptional regulator Spx [Bacilli bacterium]